MKQLTAQQERALIRQGLNPEQMLAHCSANCLIPLHTLPEYSARFYAYWDRQKVAA